MKDYQKHLRRLASEGEHAISSEHEEAGGCDQKLSRSHGGELRCGLRIREYGDSALNNCAAR
jgi:hypothetical protein